VTDIRVERPVAAALPHVERSRTRFWRDARRRRLLATADGIAVLMAALSVYGAGNSRGALALVAALPAFLVVAKLCSLYDLDHASLRHLTVDELPRIVLWALASVSCLTVVAWAFGLHLLRDGDRIWAWSCLIAGTMLMRSLARRVWREVTPPERVVLIGEGPLVKAIRRKFELFADMHADVVRHYEELDLEDLEAVGPWLASMDRVIVASRSIGEDLIAALLPLCRRNQIKLSILPPVRAAFGTTARLDRIAEVPVIEYQTWDVSRTTLLGKRALDIVVSSLLLVALLPLLLVVAAVVRVTSRGPALFQQSRAGRDGVPFRMLKFRTMYGDAEERLTEIVDLEALDEPVFKIVGDPRTTRVGRFLRRWSIDELPQLWNVLEGDMSLVGPRPEQLAVVARYRPEHQFRLSIKPGMTGPMQVFGRGDLSFDERLAVERDYVEHPALARDLRIIGLTLSAILRGDGAY
jgi:exopolysaccharide biosynthesis polyprenyl glycosylphosphotransferase